MTEIPLSMLFQIDGIFQIDGKYTHGGINAVDSHWSLTQTLFELSGLKQQGINIHCVDGNVEVDGKYTRLAQGRRSEAWRVNKIFYSLVGKNKIFCHDE